MIEKLIEIIKEALRKMVAYKDVSDTISDVQIYNISQRMKDSITLWKQIYEDRAPWIDEQEGVYSFQIGKEICQSVQTSITSEMVSEIVTPGADETDPNSRAGYLNEQYQKHMMVHLPMKLEQALAMGGMVMKPYVNGDDIYIDFFPQGAFLPIAYDDDGNITDIAFSDRFIAGDTIYTRVERQTFNALHNTITIENKAFKCKVDSNNEDEENELGTEIPLETVDKWANIQPVATIEDVEKPLFGYYKVPIANNIDMMSPMGISIFSPAVKMIKKVDEQFSRLDWEYEAGQIAIDVDDTALNYQKGYYGNEPEMDRFKDRLYRTLDLGADDTYKAFTPSLRDSNYINGLNRYLNRIEDLCGIARGTISDVQGEARTATEIKILKQKTYITISRNQELLERALQDVVYAMAKMVELYDLAPDGEYILNTEWSDSVLTDTDAELAQKMQLVQLGILSKEELRAWYTGEDEETAKAKIEEMTKGMLEDLFNQKNTLEGE